MFIIAAQLYTLRNQMRTVEQIDSGLRKVKEIGYPAVQLSGIGKIDPQHLKEILDREGLDAFATHVSWQRLTEDFDALVAEHKLWNCQYVGLGSMPSAYRLDRRSWSRFAQEASEIGKKLQDNGLQFIYHNHAFEFKKYDGVTGMEILLEESDPTTFQFELDTYWLQIGGVNIVTWIEKVGGRMEVVHFKDMGNAGENKPIMAEVGEGNMDWPQIIEACRDIGVEYAAVEQDECQHDPFTSLAISFNNLKRLGL